LRLSSIPLIIFTMSDFPAHAEFRALGYDELECRGWLRERLLLQAEGLGGHIEELWPDLGPDSAWKGGRGEAWERGPYYLDGLVPLAFALGDGTLIGRARVWIEAILASRRPDGYFGPPSNPDWWPRMVALKALLSWYKAMGDDRIVDLALDYARYQLSRLTCEPLSNWAAARGGENALVALELFSMTGEEVLLDLAEACLEQSLPWKDVFASFPYERPTGTYLPRALFLPFRRLVLALESFGGSKRGDSAPSRPEAKRTRRENRGKLFRAFHFTHNVNYAMALKYPVVEAALARARVTARVRGCSPLSDGSKGGAPGARGGAHDAAMAGALALVDSGIVSAMRHHGLPIGIWSGDEHFSGSEPTRGIELCGIAELMYSLETLVALSGEARYADRIELLAFNALPAAFTEDMCGHQYLQQVNQIEASRARRSWYDNGREANVFGLKPEFGCCAANFQQAFPKLARSLWYGTREGGLACAIYAPSIVRAKERGLSFEICGDYPATGAVELRARRDADSGGAGAPFPLLLRVPSWAQGASVSVNGGKPGPMAEPGSFHRLERCFADGDRIRLEFPMDLRREYGCAGSVSLFRGPILLALPIAETWSSLKGEAPWDYREARPASAWNYALDLGGDPPELLPAGGSPDLLFRRDAPPFRVRAGARRVPGWTREGAQAGPLPPSPVTGSGPMEEVTLVPYACARLRIAAFPWIG
jgi:hypothetical protein